MNDIGMNGRMARVFTVLMTGFVGIVALLTWWQIVDAGSLRQKDDNAQSAWYEQRIRRGVIRTADGVVLARNHAKQTGSGTIFERRYPQGSLAAHVVGYSSTGKSRAGIEKSYNDALTGSTRSLAGSVLDNFDGDSTVRGDDLQLTINAKAQRAAQHALGSRRGAVVALNPRTGALLVLASSPTYAPAEIDTDFASLARRSGSPLLDRATQAGYPPGSTFKLVTAAAALEAGRTPTDRFPGGCQVKVDSGPPVSNFGGECVGPHDLTYALTNSVNITFARLGDELGQNKLRDQMEKFGFFSTPPLDDLSVGERFTSGLYENGKLLSPDDGVDPARLGIGQERLLATPLQMALVVSAIANEGVLMQPYLVERTIAPGGKVAQQARPEEVGRAISPGTARDLVEMMQNVVREGTGTAAALSGIDVGGKTGTADAPSGNQVWFVGFAPANDPKIVVAATVEGQPSGATGGVVAAPIVKDVMEAVLGSGATP